jgi:putative cardiolipin synthase
MSRLTTVVIAVLAVCGCATLRPVAKEPEGAQAPVERGIWSDVAKAHPSPWFYLLNTGADSLAWRLRAIDSAQRSIDLETFLWKSDGSGARMLAHLISAADRGVRVRILLDDSFTMRQDLAWRAVDEHPNISLRIYNPAQQRSGDAVVERQLLNLGEFARLDHRMHNKLLLVDGRVAVVGGRNVADEYFGYDDGYNFRDVDVLTLDGSVGEMARHFDGFWNSTWTFPIDTLVPESARHRTLSDLRDWLLVHAPLSTGGAPSLRDWLDVAHAAEQGGSRFVADKPAERDPSSPDESPEQVATALLQAIEQAKSEVTLVSAYLIPTESFESAVKRAVERGVHVRILTNSLRSNNHLAAHAAYRNHVHRLLRHGADLHEVRALAKDRDRYMLTPVEAKRLGLHAKVVVIDDDLAYVGSCNLDPRSLRINTEVGLLVESPDFNRALRQALAVDFELRNAWALRPTQDGNGIEWVGDDQVLATIPADSPMQRLEDWFLSLLPTEDEM